MAATNWWFLVALGLCSGVSWLSGSDKMRTAAAILTVNWLFNVGFSAVTGSYDEYLFLLLIDGAAAWAMLSPPVGNARLVIGALYIWQCLFHGFYGWHAITGTPVDRGNYLFWLTVAGGAQLVALFVGAIHAGGKRYRADRRGFDARARARSPGFARDGSKGR